MLAATTTDTLSVVDIVLLKKGPSSVPSCLDLVEAPVASSWSPDNAFFYIASPRTIHKYDPTSNALREIYTVSGSDSICSLAVKDKNTVIFSIGNQIHKLDCNRPETETFDSHKAPVKFLSLSNDNTLLASTSAGAVHIHNVASGSHTVLRGLPASSSDIDSILFHVHSRTRLLISIARQILVYDTARPSGPIKTIPLSESAAGDIVAAACSPFSKTLVAVATSLGFVAMIDLEKEKAQVRTVNLKASLTTLEFSPEGGVIYVGTNDGKLLIVDLRSLDKPPKTIALSDSGNPVRTISIQKKPKFNADVVTKTPKSNSAITLKTPSEPLPTIRRAASANGVSSTAKSASKAVGSPILRRGKAVPAVPSVPRRAPSTLREEVQTGSPTEEDQLKNVLSPAKDPLGNTIGNRESGQLERPPESKGRKASVTPVKVMKKASSDSLKLRPTPSPRASFASSTKADVPDRGIRRSRTLPTIKGATSHIPNEGTKKKFSIPGSASVTDRLSVPSNKSAPQRSRVTSTSRAGPDSPPGAVSTISSAGSYQKRVISASTSRSPSSASRPESSVSRADAAAAMKVTPDVATARTPSPDLPEHLEPVTPFKQHKRSGLKVLGLGTPEVERWIHAGHGEELGVDNSKGQDLKGKGKTVGFHVEENPTYIELEKELLETERQLALKVSPRRPVPSTSGSTIDSWAALASSSPPLSFASPDPGNLASSGSGLPPGTTASAHDLLKTIVQDVMFDFQRDTKAEMMGLHLDLLRMGRSWKAELRVLMDEYVGDLRELREENERLRKENGRLRRGWQ